MNTSSFVSDALWEAIEPLLPIEPPKLKGGRPRVSDRAALAGVVFVLRTGCPWRLLPQELGCGSGTTCWRRMRDWQAAGVWERLHETLLNWLGDEAAIAWSRASLDSLSVRAKRGASRRGRIRSTGASWDRSTTWSSTRTASRSPSGYRRPTPTTQLTCSRSLTRFPRSSALEESRVVPGGVRPNSTRTRPTTHPSCAMRSELAVSPHASRDAGSIPLGD